MSGIPPNRTENWIKTCVAVPLITCPGFLQTVVVYFIVGIAKVPLITCPGFLQTEYSVRGVKGMVPLITCPGFLQTQEVTGSIPVFPYH